VKVRDEEAVKPPWIVDGGWFKKGQAARIANFILSIPIPSDQNTEH